MLQLARVQPGDIVLDPMCGVGTVPLVAAAASLAACAIAGDIDEHVLVQAAANGHILRVAHRAALASDAACLPLGSVDAAAANLPNTTLPAAPAPEALAWHASTRLVRTPAANGGVLPCLWSSHAIALRRSCIDVVVVDLPFGITHKVKGGGKGLKSLYASSILEMARVLRPGGRLVALATSRRAMAPALEDPIYAPLWESVLWLHVNCGGSFAWACACTRSAVAHDTVQERQEAKMRDDLGEAKFQQHQQAKAARGGEGASGKARGPAATSGQNFARPAIGSRELARRAASTGARGEPPPPPPPAAPVVPPSRVGRQSSVDSLDDGELGFWLGLGSGLLPAWCTVPLCGLGDALCRSVCLK